MGINKPQDHKKKQVVSAFKNNRNFNYTKGGVTLNFTLDIDNTLELNDFRDCLLSAVEDIREIVDKKQ